MSAPGREEAGQGGGFAPSPDAVARLDKPRDAHKHSHGHALVLSGGAGAGGAARLAARGALRVGAGLVTLACPPDAMAENAARLDAVMLARLDHAGSLAGILGERRISALCVGPGLGLDGRGREAVDACLGAALPTVLDADALTLLARDAALLSRVHRGCVATPHAGEFARLFPDLAEALGQGGAAREEACRAAAGRIGCTVLCKGPDTVVAGPDAESPAAAVDAGRGASWLATAGSGDVLSGFAAGLLARGFAPGEAAALAAWLHVRCARRIGPGLVSEDLPEALPAVLGDLLGRESGPGGGRRG